MQDAFDIDSRAQFYMPAAIDSIVKAAAAKVVAAAA
jgi:hypothetical protein